MKRLMAGWVVLVACGSTGGNGGSGPRITSFSLSPQCMRSGTSVTVTWESTGADGCAITSAEIIGSVDVPLSGSKVVGPVSSNLIEGTIAVWCWKGAPVTLQQCFTGGPICTPQSNAMPHECHGDTCAQYANREFNTDKFWGVHADLAQTTGCAATGAGGSGGGGGGGGGSGGGGTFRCGGSGDVCSNSHCCNNSLCCGGAFCSGNCVGTPCC